MTNFHENFEDATIERCPHDKENPYVMISRDLIRTQSLNPDSIWLISYLLCNDETKWKISTGQVISHLKGKKGYGRDNVREMFNQIIAAGYMQRVEYLKDGLTRYRYILSEFPKFKKCLRSPEVQAPANQGPLEITNIINIEEEEEILKINDELFSDDESLSTQHLVDYSPTNRSSREEEEIPPPIPACPLRGEIAEKLKLIEEISLTESERLRICRRSLEELKTAAAAYHRDELKIENPYAMMMAVIDGNWKTHSKARGAQKKRLDEQCDVECYRSLVSCLKTLYEERGDVDIRPLGKGFDIVIGSDFLEIDPKKLTPEFCKKVVSWLNGRLLLKTQLVYNELFGNRIFELLE